jgi:hypothetical protein
MKQLIESVTYSSRSAHATLMAELSLSLAYAKTTLAELLNEINGGDPDSAGFVQRAAGVDLPSADNGGRHSRCTLMMAGVGTAGTQVSESLYLVTPFDHRSPFGVDPESGVQGLELHKIADMTWTLGAGTIASAMGGWTNHKHAESVAVTPTGVLLAETRVEIASVNQTGGAARVTVYDTGIAVGLIRLIGKPSSSAVTSAAGRHQRWR